MDPSVRAAVMHIEKILHAIGEGKEQEELHMLAKGGKRNIYRWSREAREQRLAWLELEQGFRSWTRDLPSCQTVPEQLDSLRSKIILPFYEEIVGEENRAFVKEFLDKNKTEREKFPAQFSVLR